MFIENTNTEQQVHWLSIANGQIVKRVEEGTPGAKSRINKVGNTVWEKFFKSVVGRITSINVEVNKFEQKEIKIGIEDKQNKAVLTVNFNSSYGRSLLEQIFNVDLTKNVVFTPWLKVTEDGKKISRLYLSYGEGKKVEMKFPDGTPEIKWVKVKGKDIIDSVSQAEHESFLDEKLEEFIQKNNLVYQKSEAELKQDEMNKSLDVDEEMELKAMKKSAKKKKVEEDFDTFDDLFED